MPYFKTGKVTPSILPLWLACFPEENEDEVKALLSLFSPDGKLLYAEQDEKIVSMGILLPCLLSKRRGYYLYALCTAPAYRRRGYLRALIEEARAVSIEDNMAFMLLIPADKGLFATYRRLGFAMPISLTANPAGTQFFLPLPTGDRHPFDGNFDRLYALSDKRLSPTLFRASLLSVADTTDIFYTKDGFCVCAKADPTRGFTADAATLTEATLDDCPCLALLYPLCDDDLVINAWADPLPR